MPLKGVTGTVPIFRDKLKYSPLQAADYAAFEMYSAYKQYRVDTHKLFEKIRVSFGLLANIPHHFGDFTEERLRVFCRVREIPGDEIFVVCTYPAFLAALCEGRLFGLW